MGRGREGERVPLQEGEGGEAEEEVLPATVDEGLFPVNFPIWNGDPNNVVRDARESGDAS